jgi:hypothetical protein
MNQQGAANFLKQLRKPVPVTSGGLPSHCPEWIASSPALAAIWNAYREENVRIERVISKGDSAVARVELPAQTDITIGKISRLFRMGCFFITTLKR